MTVVDARNIHQVQDDCARANHPRRMHPVHHDTRTASVHGHWSSLQVATRAVSGITHLSWTIASATLNTLIRYSYADEIPIERTGKEIDDMQIKIHNYIVSISHNKLTEHEATATPELLAYNFPATF